MGKVTKCDRCGRRMRNPAGWNNVFSGGLLVGHTCPGCQTPEEDLEARVNEATTDYSQLRTATGEEAAEVVVRDMFGRIEKAVYEYGEDMRVAGVEGVEMDTLLDSVTARVLERLPAHYVAAYRGDMPDLVRAMARDVVTGEAYEDNGGEL